MSWWDYNLNHLINQPLKTTYVTSWKALTTYKGVQSFTLAGYIAMGKCTRIGLIFICFWQEYWHSPSQKGARRNVFAVDLIEKNKTDIFYLLSEYKAACGNTLISCDDNHLTIYTAVYFEAAKGTMHTLCNRQTLAELWLSHCLEADLCIPPPHMLVRSVSWQHKPLMLRQRHGTSSKGKEKQWCIIATEVEHSLARRI